MSSIDENAQAVRASRIVMFLPLLYILLPKLGTSGGQFITYPLMGGLIVFIILTRSHSSNLHLNKNLVYVMVIQCLMIFLMSVSMVFNNETVVMGSFIQLLKPVFFILILYFSYLAALNKGILVDKLSLLKVAYIALGFQVVVGATQLFGVDVFSLIYDDDKTRPLGAAVRIAGTMANPNIFAWIVMQMAVILFLFEPKKFKKFFFIALAFVLVFLSGSRSSLVLFPVILVVCGIMASRKSVSFYLVRIPLYLAGLFLFWRFSIWFLVNYGANFPYLYQLLAIFETGDLNDVNSFYLRTLMWSEAFNGLNNGSLLTWLFGLGPGAFGEMDNDYIYVLANYGVLYLVLHIGLYLFIFYLFSKFKDRKMRVLGQQYILFAMAIGLQADTLVGWTYPIFLFYYLGIVLAAKREGLKAENELPVRSRFKRYRLTW